MNEPPQLPPEIQIKDRRAGLVLFGVLELLLGCLCALLVPLMWWAQNMAARTTGAPPSYRMIIPNMVIYGLLAIAFIWLGVGSIRCRRWARARMLDFAWSWLLVGVLAIVAFALLMPQILTNASVGNPTLSEGAKVIMVLVSFAMLGVFFVMVPGLFVLFYRSKHVKATCAARDPQVRWTDACPLPVLAVSVWLAFGAVSMLGMVAAYNGVMPLFGRLITGWQGTSCYLVLVGLWGYAAWAIYRLKLAGWWIAVLTVALFGISNAVTFSRVDLIEMYRLMGYPEQQIEQLRHFEAFKNGLAWWTLVFAVLLLGYLIYLKKFFRRPA